MIFSSAAATHYTLDYKVSNTHQAWTPTVSQLGEWIQVSMDTPKLWTGIVVQGRGDHPSWVTSLKISYTRNGKAWKNLCEGKIFQGNSDQDQQVTIDFGEPILARALRVHPQTWHNAISMRFDAVYVELPPL